MNFQMIQLRWWASKIVFHHPEATVCNKTRTANWNSIFVLLNYWLMNNFASVQACNTSRCISLAVFFCSMQFGWICQLWHNFFNSLFSGLNIQTKQQLNECYVECLIVSIDSKLYKSENSFSRLKGHLYVKKQIETNLQSFRQLLTFEQIDFIYCFYENEVLKTRFRPQQDFAFVNNSNLFWIIQKAF